MKLYVGNLDYSVVEADLEELFAETAKIASVKLIRDLEGVSKGYAFVDIPDDYQAVVTLKIFDGSELKGRNLVIKTAFDVPQKELRQKRMRKRIKKD